MTCDRDLEGGWILTQSGRRFWPLDPRAEDVDLEDIAHALALQNRFSGHTRFPYSVAQHSVLGSYFCSEPLEFLLHDATEAYLVDLPTPLKRSLPEYRVYEQVAEFTLASVFGLRYPWSAAVKETDLRMLATERRDLLPESPWPWPCLEGVKPYPGFRIQPWPWEYARDLFLVRYKELTQPSPLPSGGR